MAERVGFIVVEYNQASGRPGLPFGADIYDSQDLAEQAARDEREDVLAAGRRERYVVCEVVELEDGTNG